MEQYLANKILNSAIASLKLEGAAIPKSARKNALFALNNSDNFSTALNIAHKSRSKQEHCLLLRAVQLLKQKPVRSFSLDTLIYIHETLFCDIRTDAGVLRRINMQKDGCEFIDYRHLSFSLNSILKQMDSIWSFDKPSRDDFAASLAHLFREMTILCPFPYGNGITIRIFLEKFSISNGFTIDYLAMSKDFLRAIDEAFRFDNIRPLYKCILRGLSYSLTPVFVATVPQPDAIDALPPPLTALPSYPTALLLPASKQDHKPFSPTKGKRVKKSAVKKTPPTPIKKAPRVAASTKRKR